MQVDYLKEDMDQVSKHGRGASEEWVKGLNTAGQQKMEDAKRFEHWEATGGYQGLLRSKVKNGLSGKPVAPALSLTNVPSYIQAKTSSAGSRTQSPLSAQYRPSPPELSHPASRRLSSLQDSLRYPQSS